MRHFILILISSILLSGCASTKNLSLGESFWQQKNHKVVVAAVKAPVPSVITEGQQGLLDLAINSAMTNTLDNHIRKTNLNWYETLPNEFSQKLTTQKIPSVSASANLSDDEKNLANLAAQHNASEVLVLHLRAVGVIRNYYGFIPTEAPQAYVSLEGKLIDAGTRQMKWRHLAVVKLPIKGQWDQPPTYPNLTTAINEAAAVSRQEVLDSFFSGH